MLYEVITVDDLGQLVGGVRDAARELRQHGHGKAEALIVGEVKVQHIRITSYNVCYTKLLRSTIDPRRAFDVQIMYFPQAATREMAA